MSSDRAARPVCPSARPAPGGGGGPGPGDAGEVTSLLGGARGARAGSGRGGRSGGPRKGRGALWWHRYDRLVGVGVWWRRGARRQPSSALSPPRREPGPPRGEQATSGVGRHATRTSSPSGRPGDEALRAWRADGSAAAVRVLTGLGGEASGAAADGLDGGLGGAGPAPAAGVGPGARSGPRASCGPEPFAPVGLARARGAGPAAAAALWRGGPGADRAGAAAGGSRPALLARPSPAPPIPHAPSPARPTPASDPEPRAAPPRVLAAPRRVPAADGRAVMCAARRPQGRVLRGREGEAAAGCSMAFWPPRLERGRLCAVAADE